MRESTGDDLVSMTAIVAGAVVSVVVTIGSMIMSGDEAREVTPASIDRPPHEVFLDARGPERGPTPAEWRVIETCRMIESMNVNERAPDVEGAALESARLLIQRYEQRCSGGSTDDAELLAAVGRLVSGSGSIDELLEDRPGLCC